MVVWVMSKNFFFVGEIMDVNFLLLTDNSGASFTQLLCLTEQQRSFPRLLWPPLQSFPWLIVAQASENVNKQQQSSCFFQTPVCPSPHCSRTICVLHECRLLLLIGKSQRCVAFGCELFNTLCHTRPADTLLGSFQTIPPAQGSRMQLQKISLVLSRPSF